MVAKACPTDRVKLFIYSTVLVSKEHLSNTGKVTCSTFMSISSHRVQEECNTAIMEFLHNLNSEEDTDTTEYQCKSVMY